MPRHIWVCVSLSIILVGISRALPAADTVPAKLDDRAAAARREEAIRSAPEDRPPNWLVLRAGDLGAVLVQKDDGVDLLSLFDLAKHRQLLARKPLPLFVVTIRHVTSKEQVCLRADAGWEQVRVVSIDSAKGAEIHWQTPKDKRFGGLRIVAATSLDPSAGAIRWKLSVGNVGQSWSVRHVLFPQVALDASSPEFTFFYPWGPGKLKRGAWEGTFSPGPNATYPAYSATMQFMAGYDPRQGTGLYCAMHDPLGGTKDLYADGRPPDHAVAVAFDVPAEDMDKGGHGYASSGEAVWQVLHGDWFDAATIYRGWVRRNATWFPKLGPDGRGDTPLWMRELPVWVRMGGDPGQKSGDPKTVVPAVEAFAKDMGVPVGFHWYEWNQAPFDNDYPHFFPAKVGFGEAVRRLQDNGVHVMPYINACSWDMRDKGIEDFEFSRVALPAAVKDEEGKPCPATYLSKESDGSPVRFAWMCPATNVWQTTVRQLTLRLANEYGVDGVYLDQIAAVAPLLCFDRAHGHPTGGGHWWTTSYNGMVDSIRRVKPADSILTSECNAEPYVKGFDGLLTWTWYHDGQVPAFPAVYGGAVQMFGRYYLGAGAKEPALRTKAGQQFVFGEQIGWFDPGVLRNSKDAALLRQVVRLRWHLRRYFYAGEMARPPRLLGAVPTIRADWQPEGADPGWVVTEAVMTGAWSLPNERRCVVLFTNVGDQPVTARLQLDAAAYGLSGKQVKVTTVASTGRGEAFQSPAAVQRDLTFPPRSALAWELTEIVEANGL